MRRKRTPQPLNEDLLKRMNIGRRYWPAQMSDFEESEFKSLMRKYAGDLERQFHEGWGLFIYGANGVGKTHASCALLKEIASQGYSTYCILSDALKAAYIDGARFDSDNTIIQRVESVDFLLLEDLGKEYNGNGSGFAELCFENLLRKRCRELLPTMITTNLSPIAFKERYKQSAASLAMECMVAVELRGSDRRAQAGASKAQELR